MSFLVEIAHYSMLLLGAVIFLLQLAAREFGYALGRRAVRGDSPTEGVGVVVSSILGLLAFVLGLTLAYSNSRFQERRHEALAEAQSIGTSWLRSQAVGGAQGAEIARLLETYAVVRLDFVRAEHDEKRVRAGSARSDALQAAIWAQMVSVSQDRRDPVVTALLSSLNETFDLAMAQRHAFASGPAMQLLALLLGMAVVGMGSLGYQFGLRGRPLRGLTLLLLGLWTAVLVLIIDLGAPRLGGIRTDPSPYLWTIESFAAGRVSGAPPPR